MLCRVGNFFVSILIPALQNRQSGYQLKPELMQQLLSALFQRAVIEDDPAWKLACMGAISTMYERYPEQFKGQLPFAWQYLSMADQPCCLVTHPVLPYCCATYCVIRASHNSVLRVPAAASARRAHLA